MVRSPNEVVSSHDDLFDGASPEKSCSGSVRFLTFRSLLFLHVHDSRRGWRKETSDQEIRRSVLPDIEGELGHMASSTTYKFQGDAIEISDPVCQYYRHCLDGLPQYEECCRRRNNVTIQVV